jgi:NAD(P)-dependent dehydrogenase (short-subunit alcohol dehydrogenase family)
MSGHVLVTGAASGIGQATAESFAADGWQVTGVDIRVSELAAAMGALPEGLGAAVPCDLADPSAPEKAIATAWAREPLSHVVNAAGIYPAISFLDLGDVLWDRVQAVNVRAPMLLTQAFARRAIDAGRTGSVVNISSGAALRARPGAAHYCTSKAALEMLTRAAAVELGSVGIRVNAVSPGFVTVKSRVNPVSDEYADAVSANLLGRRGQPSDIASAVRWLCSTESGWVTGTILRVDGGMSAGTNQLPLHWTGLTAVQSGAYDGIEVR